MGSFALTMPSTTLLFFAALIAAFAFICYRFLLPRPIPGIPHHKSSARSILGDIPSMIKHVNETHEVFTWMTAQCYELNSPIIQLFIRPFGAPKVVICDFRETQDIAMRRLKDFDRSEFFFEILGGLIPDHHIHMPTNARMKAQKRLLSDTMTPSFLNQVAAPRIYETVVEVIQLWRIKASLAQGRAFEASEDIKHFALDAIWAATFGSSAGTTESQVNLLSSLPCLRYLPKDEDQAVEFPKAVTPPTFNAVITLTESLNRIVSSPNPRIHHWVLRKLPGYRNAANCKDQLFSDHMTVARKKFAESPGDEHVRSALDHLFQREQSLAVKEDREPVFDTPVARDELFGFLVGGHDTTSTTLSWGMKLLADNPSTANALRSALYATLAPDVSSTTLPPPQPAASAIAKANIPYLDAVIEEMLRCAGTVPGVFRRAIRDTEVLGHHIPKGTDVFTMSNGPSIYSPPMHIREEDRSMSGRGGKELRGAWDEAGMRNFKPERWLKTPQPETGEAVFDPLAGPNAPFGFGPRGCFGKRLAYIEMRITLTLVVWHFNLLKCPSELSTYAANDLLTHQPQKCYVRLETV